MCATSFRAASTWKVNAPGSPTVELPCITFEVFVGSKGITLFRHHSLRGFAAISPLTRPRVVRPARPSSTCALCLSHGQFHVVLSRPTCCKYVRFLILPARLVGDLPHALNIVYTPLFRASTGSPLPSFPELFSHVTPRCVLPPSRASPLAAYSLLPRFPPYPYPPRPRSVTCYEKYCSILVSFEF